MNREIPDTTTPVYYNIAVLMGKYNQQYSEIRKIPTKVIIYLLALAEAESNKIKSDMKDLENKGK